MLIIGVKRIIDAYTRHPTWKPSLTRWVTIVKEVEWRHFPDVRRTFSSADLVGSYVIFNIAGNNARLISVITLQKKRVLVQAIVSHAEYDREDWA